MRLEFLHKKAWGKDRYYPKNELTDGLQKLIQQESFTIEQVRLLKSLGFTIVLHAEKPKDI